jgi:4-hydroxybenzoate polyprenyltransferase
MGAPPAGPPGGGHGGGDAPLGRIPFSPEDEKNIQQTALFMKVAGAIAIVGALFGLVAGVGVNLYTGMPALGGVCFGSLVLGVQGLLATLLFMSSNAFARIVSTDGDDQGHLAEGLRKLRVYFLVKAALWVLGFLTCCCFAILAATMGAALFSMLAGAAASSP